MTATTLRKSRRQQQIEHLVRERRNLRKQWKRASQEKRANIDLLQADLKGHLGSLQRAENIRLQRKRKERARTSFFKDRITFVKGIFTEEKSGSLKVPKRELEDHLKMTHTDWIRGHYHQACHHYLNQNIRWMTVPQDGVR